LVLHAADLDPETVDVDNRIVLAADQIAAVEALLNTRIRTRKPLAYLINEAWFAGLRFFVDERVIVPRSHLGEWLIDGFQPWVEADRIERALDLGCGSGCIAVALAQAFPAARVEASDISADALAVARINLDRHGVADRVGLLRSDLFANLRGRRYDLIVSNPPYVDTRTMQALPAEYRCEPEIAFAAGDDGLDILARILAQARGFLSDRGTLIVEAGSAARALEARYSRVPFTWLSSSSDESVVFLLSAAELDRYAVPFRCSGQFSASC